MINFIEYTLLEGSAKEYRDEHGVKHFNKIISHPYYKENFANDPEDATFTHKVSPSGAIHTTTVHTSRKLAHFIKVGNKITNAHFYHKSGDHWQHIKSQHKESTE